MNFMMTRRVLLEMTHAFKQTELQSLYEAVNMQHEDQIQNNLKWEHKYTLNNDSDCSVRPKHGDIMKVML
jgi:hypothetical protein